MKALDVVTMLLAIVSALLVSSGVAYVGHAFDLATAGPVPAAAAEPVVSGSGPEGQRSVEENRDKRDALGFLLLFGMFEGPRGR
jgi:hypothetical protein